MTSDPVSRKECGVLCFNHSHPIGDLMKDDNKTKKQLIQELTELRSQDAELKKSESAEKYRSLVENIRDVIYELDSQGVVLYISPAVRDMLGFDSAEIIGKNFIELAHKNDLSRLAEWFSELRKGREYPSEYRVSNKSGEIKWVYTRPRPIMEDGLFKGARGILIDVTAQKRAEAALLESEKLFKGYLENAPDGIYMSDLEGNFLYGNSKCEEMIGYRREELIGKNLLELNILPGKYLDKAAQLLQANIEGKSTGPDDFDLITKEGRLIPVEINTGVVQRMGQVVVLASVRDITERRLVEEKIQQMAYHDSLTGLPNRKLFSDRLGITLAHAQRNQKKVGIAMLDLDKFKDVNDTLGHDVGDLLLKAAAERLSAALRKGDTVARFGGDEFVLILPDLKGIEDVLQVAQKIVESFRKPFLINTHQLSVTTSIGIAVYPQDGTDETILLKNADIAMYQVKQTGRDRYQLCKQA